MRQNFARTGTSHLLVINGLHLGMVALVTYFLSFWLLRRFPRLLLRVNAVKIATLLAAIPVVFYAWVAGGSPSTQRAEVMVLAYLLLVFLGRPGEVWSALALAALIILSLAPLRLFSISFQLSFAAVAFLIYLVPRLVRHPEDSKLDHPVPGAAARLLFRIKEWFVVSVVATLATAPLVALYFQVVSLLGILVNLVAIPLVLLLALPLGEAAVISQALSLTPVAQALLFRGQIPPVAGLSGGPVGGPGPRQRHHRAHPHLADDRRLLCRPDPGLLSPAHVPDLGRGGLWRGWCWWAPSPCPWPRRRGPGSDLPGCLWGAGGGGGNPGEPPPGGVRARPPRWGRPGPGWGPLPGYLHWRQFRRLDLAIALNLNEANAGELLTLARQFTVGSYWYGGRGRAGPGYWDLANYLGDRGATPRSLDRGRPPGALGSVDLKYVKLARGRGPGPGSRLSRPAGPAGAAGGGAGG